MAKETQRSGADGAMELLGVGGFALFFGWMLITFYWLFAIFLQSLPTGERDTIQLFIFIGIALGYAICHADVLRFHFRSSRHHPVSNHQTHSDICAARSINCRSCWR